MNNQGRKAAGYGLLSVIAIPSRLFDELMYELTPSELRVLLYLHRKTFGQGAGAVQLSLNELLHGERGENGQRIDRGTELSTKSLLSALKSLEVRGLIIVERIYSTERGNEPSVYRVNWEA